ncbi:ATP-binding protein [Candidatus Peregrinibacteria bacterium]|nr:ATP-binding protein [Candidatus Peregrinibacteria bacterium]
MIRRTMASKLRQMARGFPVIFLTGPRQSGKTTLVQSVFPNHRYVSLENLDSRQRIQEDPRGFLEGLEKGVILDEVQRVPELFSYLQTAADASETNGKFILTGSQNFLLMEKITQSLAGRAGVLHLLPFALEELFPKTPPGEPFERFLFKGLYPPLYDRKVSPEDWYGSYLATYLERDVRQMKQVGDLGAFQKFMRLCAGRCGHLLNLSSLGNECGVSHSTAKSWLSVLQASFIVFLLEPYYRNFNKRVVKQPKLYFYDPGLACALLGVSHESQLKTHYMRGALFETLIVSELIKRAVHRGKRPQGYFWRDHRGNEVDYVEETPRGLVPMEIKAGATVTEDSFQGLQYFHEIVHPAPEASYLIYGGREIQQRRYGKAIPWREMKQMQIG